MDDALNLFWFRRDLRIKDNRGLNACIGEGGPYALIVIMDDDILSNPSLSEKRVAFFRSAVRHLSEIIKKAGSELYILKGKPIEVFRELCHKNRIRGVYFNDDYEPYAVKRDTQVETFLTQGHIVVKRYKDSVLHEYNSVLKKDDTPYKMFTPYYKKWLMLPKDKSVDVKRFERYGLKTAKRLEWNGNLMGFESGEAFFNQFFEEKIGDYVTLKDYPGYDQTSHFSKYLRFGTLSIRSIYHRANLMINDSTLDEKIRNSAETFIRQLAWRDFYFQILYHHPEVVQQAFKKKYDAVRWENDRVLFDKWCCGKTGFPFVDAGMRQLNEEGWMHNRLRMITASFLVKDLLIDWRWGADYFQRKLLDHDLALNNGGWQWCASTGTDSQPWFRVFNPFSQSEKFDPHGEFIRKYVPELRNIPGKYIHRPFKLSEAEQKRFNCIIGKDYPSPIVNHDERRKQTIEMFRLM